MHVAGERPRPQRGGTLVAAASNRHQKAKQTGAIGTVPNLFWTALSPTSLRRMTAYTALPPPDAVPYDPNDPSTYRYVRQGTQHWVTLRQGRLTTSLLKDALGLRDATACRRLRTLQRSSPGVLAAYQHLAQTQDLGGASATAPTADGAANRSAAGGGSGRSGDDSATAGSGRATGHPSGAALACEEARLQYNARLADAAPVEAKGWSVEERRALCRQEAACPSASTAVRLRLLWGTLQEDAGVASLPLLVPGVQVEEVGLLCIDPQQWGVDANEVPLLGASPDALVTHHVPITARDLLAAREQLAAMADESAARDTAHTLARAILRAALQRHTAPAPPGPLAAASSPPPLAAAHAPPPPPLPHAADGSTPLYENGQAAVQWLARQLLAPPPPQQQPPGPRPPQDAHPGGGSGGSGDATTQAAASMEVVAVVRVREAVEVKSACPFSVSDRRGRVNVNRPFVKKARGPARSVSALHVPQLQAHMAGCQADSALLLSRCPQGGIRVFRMYRDDEYLTAAMELLRELQVGHVLRRQPPPHDPWADRRGFGDFLARTEALAEGAAVVTSVPLTPQLEGTDVNAFWAPV